MVAKLADKDNVIVEQKETMCLSLKVRVPSRLYPCLEALREKFYKAVKEMLAKLNRKQSRRMRDVNHKVSRTIVDLAKQHQSAIVLENLQGIRKGKDRRYVDKSQWAFYQLEQFLCYKALLSGVPI